MNIADTDTVRQKVVKPLDASTDKVIEMETWKEASHLYTVASKLGKTGTFETYYMLVKDAEQD